MHTLEVVGAFVVGVALVYVSALVLVWYCGVEEARLRRKRIEADLRARKQREGLRLVK